MKDVAQTHVRFKGEETVPIAAPQWMGKNKPVPAPKKSRVELFTKWDKFKAQKGPQDWKMPYLYGPQFFEFAIPKFEEYSRKMLTDDDGA